MDSMGLHKLLTHWFSILWSYNCLPKQPSHDKMVLCIENASLNPTASTQDFKGRFTSRASPPQNRNANGRKKIKLDILPGLESMAPPLKRHSGPLPAQAMHDCKTKSKHRYRTQIASGLERSDTSSRHLSI
jgi:hypothetical protein